MSILGNLIWLVFGGLIMALAWVVAGLLLCLTLIGIPFGVQCFKIAGFILLPFGRDIIPGNFGVIGTIGNILWILFCGLWLALAHFFLGLALCLTIIGIPFGLQHFKVAKLAMIPFGAQIHNI